MLYEYVIALKHMLKLPTIILYAQITSFSDTIHCFLMLVCETVFRQFSELCRSWSALLFRILYSLSLTWPQRKKSSVEWPQLGGGIITYPLSLRSPSPDHYCVSLIANAHYFYWIYPHCWLLNFIRPNYDLEEILI